jgi:SAM-dependent methyltransferase
MLKLQIPDNLALPPAAAPFLGSVSLDLATDDGMFHGNHAHYLSCGASALNVILGALMLAQVEPPRRVLDFGAGAGRVSRWLRAAFPTADIHTCDLREQDMRFNADAFRARTWTSGTDIDGLEAPATYDLIWLGSVATHLSPAKTEKLLDKMLSWSNPSGMVVMSLHGRYAYKRQSELGFDYIDAAAWELITQEYETTGYGYADYEGLSGYGISLSKPSWIAALVEGRPGIRLVMLAEKVWDDHHDVLAVQNRSL